MTNSALNFSAVVTNFSKASFDTQSSLSTKPIYLPLAALMPMLLGIPAPPRVLKRRSINFILESIFSYISMIRFPSSVEASLIIINSKSTKVWDRTDSILASR